MKTLGAAGVVLLVILLSGNVKPAGGTSPDKPAPVSVTNTPFPVSASDTVPVNGTVGATQSGPWTAGISGTPSVGITGTPTVHLAPGTMVGPVPPRPEVFHVTSALHKA